MFSLSLESVRARRERQVEELSALRAEIVAVVEGGTVLLDGQSYSLTVSELVTREGRCSFTIRPVARGLWARLKGRLYQQVVSIDDHYLLLNDEHHNGHAFHHALSTWLVDHAFQPCHSQPSPGPLGRSFLTPEMLADLAEDEFVRGAFPEEWSGWAPAAVDQVVLSRGWQIDPEFRQQVIHILTARLQRKEESNG